MLLGPHWAPAPAPPAPVLPLAKVETDFAIVGNMYTEGEKGTSSECSPNSLVSSPASDKGGDCYPSGRGPRSFCCSPFGPGSAPSSKREATTAELRRILGLHLALILASLTPGPPTTKAVAASAPLDKRHSVLTTDPALLPKPLATHRLPDDVSLQ